MNAKEFIEIFREGIKDLFRGWKIIIPSLFLWGVIYLISRFGGNLAYRLQTTVSNIAWTGIAWVVSLVVMSYFFSGMIGMAFGIVRGKKNSFFKNSNKFWFRNLVILIIIGVMFNILINGSLFIFSKAMIWLSQSFTISVFGFKFISIIISFIWLASVLIFLTFSSFFLIKDDLKVVESFKRSKNFVKKNYLGTLSLSVVLFVVFYLIARVGGIYGNILEYGILLPLIVLIFVRFVNK
jgi:hypothetical protein